MTDEDLNVAEEVEYFLEHCSNLHDYIDETEVMSSRVNNILNDADEDKIGRIRDLYRDRIEAAADLVAAFYDQSDWASYVYRAMLHAKEVQGDANLHANQGLFRC